MTPSTPSTSTLRRSIGVLMAALLVAGAAHAADDDCAAHARPAVHRGFASALGCTARALNEDIVVDRTELEEARWFDRAELALMHKRQHPDGLFAAHPFAIAHHLIGQWLHGGKDGRA